MERVTLVSSGIDLVADVGGPADAPSVLLLHTGGGNRSVWVPIAERIAALGWRTIAPDFRGHGDSGWSPAYHLDDLCTDTLALARKLAGEPCVVVGGSLGGVVGMLLVGEHRLAAAGVVLLDVGPYPKRSAGQRELTKLTEAAARGEPAVESLDPKLMEGSLVRDVISQRARIRAAATELSIPVLLVYGSRSHVIDEESLAIYRRAIPHGESVEVEAGHLIARDRPQRLVTILTGFLNRIPRP